MINDGKARFTDGDVFGAGGDPMRAVAVGDIDKDGDNDIVVANDCQASAVYYNTLRSPRRASSLVQPKKPLRAVRSQRMGA